MVIDFHLFNEIIPCPLHTHESSSPHPHLVSGTRYNRPTFPSPALLLRPARKDVLLQGFLLLSNLLTRLQVISTLPQLGI